MDGNDDFGSEFDCGYTQQHIVQCVGIVDQYVESLNSLNEPDDDVLRHAIEKVVRELNDLNDRAGGCLIETDQREDLCQIILVVAKQAGMKTDEDVTEEWREW